MLSNRMKMAKVLFSFIFLVFFSLGAQSQNNKNQAVKTTRTLYFYSFTGVQSEQQMSLIEQQMASIKYVETVKTKYKPERQAGQVILTVAIESNGSEERIDFETVKMKQILLQNNLTPGTLEIKAVEEKK